ncbi:MAG: PQQ-binding-like beta-propeller repeat protein [Pseudomonadota bacterium]
MTFWSAVRLPSDLVCISTANDVALVIDPTDGRTVVELSAIGVGRSVTLSTSGHLLVLSDEGHPNWTSHLSVFDAVTFQRKGHFVAGSLRWVGCADDLHAFCLRSEHGSDRNDFVAIRLDTGLISWSINDVGQIGGAEVSAGVVYLAAEKVAALRALNAATGASAWSDLAGLKGGAITLVEGMLYVGVGDGSFENSVRCYDVASRTELWNGKTAGLPDEIVVHGGSVFVTSSMPFMGIDVTASMRSFDTKTGKSGFFLVHGNRPMGKLGVNDNFVFVPMVERGENDLPGGGLLCYGRHGGGEVFRSYFDWTRGIYAIPFENSVLFSTHSQFGLFHLRTLWSASLGATSRVRPATRFDTVLVGTSAGDILRLDAREGREIWRIEGNAPVNAAPTIHNAVAYAAVGSDVIAADLETGAVQWHLDLGAPVRGYVNVRRVGETIVAVGTQDGDVFVLDADTGQQRLSFAVGATVSTPMLISDQFLVTGSDSGRVSVVGYDGELIWEVAATPPHAIRSLMLARGMILVADAGGSLSARSFLDGSEIWRTRLDNEIDATGVIDRRRFDAEGRVAVFVVDAKGVVSAINRQDGEILWQSEPTGIGTRVPVAHAYQLVLVSDSGRVLMIRQKDGAITREFELDRTIVSEVGAGSANPDYLLVSDDRGHLHRLIV